MFNYKYTVYIPTTVEKWLRENIEWNVTEHFGGFTKYKAKGAWDGGNMEVTKENVFVYEILSKKKKDHIIKAIADTLKVHGEQEVLYSITPTFMRKV